MKKTGLKKKLIWIMLAVGIIPLAIVGYYAEHSGEVALEKATYQKLESIREIKKVSIKDYFKQIQGQIKLFSEDLMIVNAAKELVPAFNKFRAENSSISVDNIKQSLNGYYTREFSPEYQGQNDNMAPDLSFYNRLKDDAIALQYFYIKNNSHPLGSKHLLNSAADQSTYSKIHAKYHPIIRDFLETFHYYDIFIVDIKTGNIVYSVYKELDFATSVIDGPYANTGIGEAFQASANASHNHFTYLTDYAPYFPSYNAPAGFISSPIYDGHEKIGVLIFQMPISEVNRIMAERSGMGKTGESYLVGKDKLMRSDSYLDPKEHSVAASFRHNNAVRTEAVEKALAGESNEKIITDYNGNPVLSAYSPIKLTDNLTWAILVEIDEAEAFAPIFSLRYWVIVIIAIAIIAIVFVGMYFGHSISKPLLDISSNINSTATEVASASGELSSASQTLASASTEQASSIEETSASLEELSGMVSNNVGNAESSAEISEDVKNVSVRGGKEIMKLVESMKDILKSNDEIQQLVDVIGQIGEKTAIIDEIVFQTKLLSFNASVEAERAGEHGRGFAVVAQEVGNLAQMSGKAALEISTIVKESINNAKAITSGNKVKVEEGNKLVQKTAEILKEVEEKSKDVASNINNILKASREQSVGIDQINSAVVQLDKTTQSNAATSEQTASSSEELNAQAENLKLVVNEMVTIVAGENKS